MEASKLADVLVALDIINGHDIDGAGFGTYSVKPHGKMCYLAEEVVQLPTVVDAAQERCLQEGFPLRISHRGDKYVVIAEKVWATVEHEQLNVAIMGACALALVSTLGASYLS